MLPKAGDSLGLSSQPLIPASAGPPRQVQGAEEERLVSRLHPRSFRPSVPGWVLQVGGVSGLLARHPQISGFPNLLPLVPLHCGNNHVSQILPPVPNLLPALRVHPPGRTGAWVVLPIFPLLPPNTCTVAPADGPGAVAQGSPPPAAANSLLWRETGDPVLNCIQSDQLCC